MTSSDSRYDLELPLQGRIRPRRVHLARFTSSSSPPGSVLAYLGIPFAQPPTRARRWQVPQGPLPTWSSTRASAFGADPHQDFAAMEGMYRGRTSAKTAIPRSEDCLYLNVWVPETTAAAAADRPVLVWIYGGAFSVGNASRPLHDGARLAHESGCIVVALTYRVGAMGFLGSRALVADAAGEWPLLDVAALHSKPGETEVGAGNWGLWDLVAGLVWVQGSIGAFGGDAGNVTLFGESAGSIAIHYLLLSPRVPEALFHKAILESGVAATLVPRTTEASQACWEALVAALCPHLDDEAEQLDYMRLHVRADQIDAVLRPLVGKRPRSEYTPTQTECARLPRAREDCHSSLGVTDQWGPVWDGVLVDADFLTRAFSPLPARSELRNGRAGVVLGLCADEGTMFNFLVATTQSLAAHVQLFHPSLATDLQQLYGFDAQHAPSRRDKVASDRNAFYTCAAYTGDAQFTAPILDYMHTQRRRSGHDVVPMWGYLLAHRPSVRMLEALTVVPEMAEEWGVFHTLDIPLVFGLTGSSHGEEHVWTSSAANYGVDPDDDDRAATQVPLSPDRGMTIDERRLSLYMMQTWTAIARLAPTHGDELRLPDGELWQPLGSTPGQHGGVGDVELLALGQASQSPTELTKPTEATPVRVWQTQLAEHPFATHPPVGAASLQQRVEFWLHQPISSTTPDDPRLVRYLQNYYGWLRELPCFRPWPPVVASRQPGQQ